jgi:hypothetical protein
MIDRLYPHNRVLGSDYSNQNTIYDSGYYQDRALGKGYDKYARNNTNDDLNYSKHYYGKEY